MVQTKKTGTLRDKDDKSFIESPARGEKYTAVETFVSNTYDNPIPVDPTTRGTPDVEYNEVSAVGNDTVTIINKTIQAGVLVDLTGAYCSGDNIAHFIVEINGQVKYKGRTYWSNFNLPIDLNIESLVENDNVKIIVENKTNKAAQFNATLKFSELII